MQQILGPSHGAVCDSIYAHFTVSGIKYQKEKKACVSALIQNTSWGGAKTFQNNRWG